MVVIPSDIDSTIILTNEDYVRYGEHQSNFKEFRKLHEYYYDHIDSWLKTEDDILKVIILKILSIQGTTSDDLSCPNLFLLRKVFTSKSDVKNIIIKDIGQKGFDKYNNQVILQTSDTSLNHIDHFCYNTECLNDSIISVNCNAGIFLNNKKLCKHCKDYLRDTKHYFGEKTAVNDVESVMSESESYQDPEFDLFEEEPLEFFEDGDEFEVEVGEEVESESDEEGRQDYNEDGDEFEVEVGEEVESESDEEGRQDYNEDGDEFEVEVGEEVESESDEEGRQDYNEDGDEFEVEVGEEVESESSDEETEDNKSQKSGGNGPLSFLNMSFLSSLAIVTMTSIFAQSTKK
ncbi:hypothetical protein TetV_363 [Tetraselmis virus 1]|uniref:Uncharacterized protein n=1 Tax=Tetraselmis virus 1 TaxID=2060617 RepID=A0A2P0VNH8_9VIRU|nr:hypothetical protein QJ968_gp363 [Tetraselmis virus 1]AUF82455.1 hypothetical protein TetV_363 [Tetraselmis virus 1]